MSKVELPVRHIKRFVTATSGWLRKCPDYKKGLELRLKCSQEDGSGPFRLHCSVGGSSYFAECLIEDERLSAPFEFFLDFNYVQDYSFNEEYMTVTVPESTGKEDRKLQFRGKGVSLKVPLRSGSHWALHEQALKDIESIPGFGMTSAFLEANFAKLLLPNSFTDDAVRNLQIRKGDRTIQIYSNDSFGAYYHDFDFDGIIPICGGEVLKLSYDFFLPWKSLKDQKLVLLQLKADLFQNYGRMEFEEGPYRLFGWCQPIPVRPIEDVPAIIAEARKNVTWSLAVDTKQFRQHIEQVTSFYKKENFLQNPIQLVVVGDQYTLTAVLPTSDIVVEGKFKNAAPSSVRARFQAGSLSDYFEQLDAGSDSNIEILRNSAIVYQSKPPESLAYWMPIQER